MTAISEPITYTDRDTGQLIHGVRYSSRENQHQMTVGELRAALIHAADDLVLHVTFDNGCASGDIEMIWFEPNRTTICLT